ncbi:beta-galactosidase [Microbacter margulisiae]|uniref:Glycoside hydrolase 35 catalytic domain-containing protein n=1 Tax=Microbacter margulisiae TaxID=1350067 RepID=A0A7W5DPB8_9PORP|nr:beta-galactosidase [Microbacter margulisiae]MBB3186551.1 hypothetical protein [Microbacter margulisiae]
MSQLQYKIDASNVMRVPEIGRLKMGNSGTRKERIQVNSLYMTCGGKPVIPVMGEIHFSRLKPNQWEDCILKMKACGINIISTYLFWNYHEEIEGQFDWRHEKNIRKFVQLCQKDSVNVFLRIGPWSHGEVRNGGTPDWILSKTYLINRSNDVVYQHYVKQYFREIAKQLKGLYYKDGGNIIGIQLENEYWFEKRGEAHILWLKKIVKELGMDVPLYTVTGWGGGSVPPFEVIPMWGGYADEPWLESVHKDVLPWNFKFDFFRDNKHIGNNPLNQKQYMNYDNYPYFTCEMGVGVQNTYHRRLTINPIDGLGMVLAKLGSGSNLVGYYMFAGGTNPHGLLHSTEEERQETGGWSRLPVKSYDFQAAIKESGELSDSYFQVKKINYFLNDFGDRLAPMLPVVYHNTHDSLQLAVRSNNTSGFLFGINYCRYVPKKILLHRQFCVKFSNETLVFPSKGIDIPDSTLFVWPMNFSMGSIILKYATAQLLCEDGNSYIFFQNNKIQPEFAFDHRTIRTVTTSTGVTRKKGNLIVISNLVPSKDCVITLKAKNGDVEHIIVLNERDAEHAWLFKRDGRTEFYISNASLYLNGNNIWALSTQRDVSLYHLQKEVFIHSNISSQKQNTHIQLTTHSLFADSKWLQSGDFKKIPDYMERYHRFFFKEFSLSNPSSFRKVTLYIYPETCCQLNINRKWVQQKIRSNQVNAIDITGYVTKGDNMLFLAFPFVVGKKEFAARVIVEYSNADRVDFSTDLSWLTTDMYTMPTSFSAYNRPERPTIAPSPIYASNLTCPNFREWTLAIPHGILDSLNAFYVHIRYIGDRAELYNGYRLVADDFNNNKSWHIGLQRLNPPPEGDNLRLIIYPLRPSQRIFFDIPPKVSDYGKMEIKNIEIQRERIIHITE